MASRPTKRAKLSEIEDVLDDELMGLDLENIDEEILKMVDDAPEVKELDAPSLRHLVLKFEQAVNLNVQMRDKYSNEPNRFMDSEVALDEAVKALSPLAATPHLYPIFVQLNALGSLLSLIPHENPDIGVAVIALLSELLDADNLTAFVESIELVDSLMELQGVTVIVRFLERLDEKNQDDSQAVYNILGIVDSLADAKPEICELLTSDGKKESKKETKSSFNFISWVLSRMKKDKFDINKSYCAEVLSILLQSEQKVRKAVGSGLRKLVSLVAKYRKKDPASEEEIEYLENLFLCLCCALREPENQTKFLACNGIELMIVLVRKRMYAKAGAMKVIDFALTNCVPNAEKFIDTRGLKSIFTVFMGKGKKKKHEKTSAKQNIEHAVSVMVQLFLSVSNIRYYRLLRKFEENECEKIERLIELFDEYYRQVEDVDAKLALEQKETKEEEDEEEDIVEKYSRRCEAGLLTLRFLCFLLGFIATAGEPKLRKRVIQLLNQQDCNLGRIKAVLDEYAANMGDEQNERKIKLVLEGIAGSLMVTRKR